MTEKQINDSDMMTEIKKTDDIKFDKEIRTGGVAYQLRTSNPKYYVVSSGSFGVCVSYIPPEDEKMRLDEQSVLKLQPQSDVTTDDIRQAIFDHHTSDKREYTSDKRQYELGILESLVQESSE